LPDLLAAAQDAALAQLKAQFEQLADYLADEHHLPFVIERVKERLEELRRLQRENEWLKTVEYLLSPEEWGHDALDIVGFIPVIGEIADGINALWYAAEGDYTNAALSGAAIIPVVGDIGGKGFRQGKKLLKGAKALDKLNDARRLYRRTTSTAEAAENLGRSSRKLDDIPALARTSSKTDDVFDPASRQFKVLNNTTCFLAGTPVVVAATNDGMLVVEPGELAGLSLDDLGELDVLLAATAFGVGVVGYRRLRKRRTDEQERQFDELPFELLEDEDKETASENEPPTSGTIALLDTSGETPDDQQRPGLPQEETSVMPTVANETRRKRPTRSRFATASRRASLWLLAWAALGLWFLAKAGPFTNDPLSPTAEATATRRTETNLQPQTVAIEQLRVGQRLPSRNPDLAGHRFKTAVDPATWKLLKLRAVAVWNDGTRDVYEIETLQPPAWIKQHNAKVGATVPIPLDLVEMGSPPELTAKVLAIERCPPIEHGPGQVVLTTVNHLNAFVFRLTSTVNPDAKQIDYRYDSLGLRSGMTDPDGGRTTYSYDAGSRMRSLLNTFSERTTWLYDAAGRVTLTYLGNGTRTSQTHDAIGQVTDITHFQSDDTVLAGQSYQYDPVGNKLRVAESSGDRVTWTYDENNRLISEHRTGTQPYRITHTYDLADNRTVKADTSDRTTFSYNAGNELETSVDANGTTTYTYDADGNQATRTEPNGDITTNVWDSLNRLSSVILPAGATHTFLYAPTGLRVKAEDGTDTTKFLWDAMNVLLETDASDVTQALYTLNPRKYGNLLSRRDGSSSRFYHFDQLGSTLLLSDGTETPTSQYIYEAYGSMLAQPAGITNAFTFVGQSGYQFEPAIDGFYVRARWYDPTIARLLSRDPLGSTDAMNLYDYVKMNPLVLTDPSGLQIINPPPPPGVNVACWNRCQNIGLALCAVPLFFARPVCWAFGNRSHHQIVLPAV